MLAVYRSQTSLSTTRIKCTRLPTDKLVGILQAWGKKRGEFNFIHLLSSAKPFLKSRSLPPNSILLLYVDLAALFVRVCPNLKASHVEVYDALIQVHCKDPCLGQQPYNTARDISAIIRKICGWYREIASNHEKRQHVLSQGDKDEHDLIFDVCNQVKLDGTEAFSVSAGAEGGSRFDSPCPTRSGSPSSGMHRSNSTQSLQSQASDEDDFASLLDAVIDMSAPGTAIVPFRPKLPDDDPVKNLEDAFESIEFMASSRGSTVVTTTTAALKKSTSAAGGFAHISIIQKIQAASSTPLPSSRGSVQRAVTQATKGKPIKKTPTKPDGGTVAKKPCSDDVAKQKTIAYEIQKRKRRAFKAAQKKALGIDGKTPDEALFMGRQAYAECA